MFLMSGSISSCHTIFSLPSDPTRLSDRFRRKHFSFFFRSLPSAKSRFRPDPRIHAALRRSPNSRRNVLRKRFLSRDNQVLQFPKPSLNNEPSAPVRDEGIEIPENDTSTSGSRSVESAFRGKLENWIEQYREDNILWGIGTGAIFVAHRGPDGKIVRVSVDRAEIARRSGIGREEGEVAAKIRQAEAMAKEIVAGEYVVPANSSVVKFVEDGWTVNSSDRSLYVDPPGEKLQRLVEPPRLVLVVVCGCVLFWLLRRFYGVEKVQEESLTLQEKEMLRRKLKARKHRDGLLEGSVDVIQDEAAKSPSREIRRPELDREELDKDLVNAKIPKEISAPRGSCDLSSTHGDSFNDKVKDIREMARKVREFERREPQGSDALMGDDLQLEESGLDPTTANSNAGDTTVEKSKDFIMGVPKVAPGVSAASIGRERVMPGALNLGDSANDGAPSGLPSLTENLPISTKPEIMLSVKEAMEYLSRKNIRIEESPLSSLHSASGTKQVGDVIHGSADSFDGFSASASKNIKRMNKSHGSRNADLLRYKERKKMYSGSEGKSPTDMKSSTLSRTDSEHIQVPSITTWSGNNSSTIQPNIKDGEHMESEPQCAKKTISMKKANFPQNGSAPSESEFPETGKMNQGIEMHRVVGSAKGVEKGELNNLGVHLSQCTEDRDKKCTKLAGSEVPTGKTFSSDGGFFCGEGTENLSDNNNGHSKTKQVVKKNWLEEYFHEFEPISKKIGEGFQRNYSLAKQKAQECDAMNVDLNDLGFPDGNNDVDWMKDEKLKEIVFKVRENELSGKDPFSSMSAYDKQAFFQGLEKQAEKINAQLLSVHEYLHSRIENIDYGADGISLYDPPEKIVPRWKGSVVDRYPEFLNNPVKIVQAPCSNNEGKNCKSNDNGKTLQNSSADDSPTISVNGIKKKPQSGASALSGTIIECSDGSSRASKKGAKDHWEHTKKWSREFLEIYNAETDPDVKSSMKGMGKNLDRWITDKEVEEAAKLMTRIPKKEREFIEKKMDKIKREMEIFGSQAVVSKYREYSERKEEDYLWWLDRKFVLCIELYMVEDGSQQIGFYSLEMASDLNLDPRQFHVVAFEDPGDSKNFCYIMQAHLEMLGKGNAFVVARSPKDAFRDAKANGFHVTVIKKGELKLNIDRTLEEVEEEIIEIGSRMYQDRIMRERSVDMSALMNGIMASE